MHTTFAQIYDEFMKGVNYASWYKFLRTFITKKGKILDIGCGTGTIAKFFEDDNFDVTAIDISDEMIKIANSKLKNTNLINTNMLEYLNEDSFEFIVCNFDTINYLNDFKELEKFLEISYKNLKKGGYFIFDIVSNEIFDEIFENDLFVDTTDNYTCIWYHQFLKKHSNKYYKKHLVSMEIFFKKENNLFEKIEEVEYKTIFDFDFLIQSINKIGFEIYDTAKNSNFGESRVFFVLKNENIDISK